MRPRHRAVLGLLVVAACACGSGSAVQTGPRVDLIDDAVDAVDAHYGAPQDYFEISATLERVSVIVAVEGATAAEQGYFEPDAGFTVPEPVGAASGATFTADALEFDADRIFDGVRDELDDPVIVDFAIQGGPDGSVIYDATVSSAAGGAIRVLLSADGAVLGAQAA